MDIQSTAHEIQLAVAPVFLLTGVAALLGVMTTRLSRVIDRARSLEGDWSSLDEKGQVETRSELALLERRAHLASWAINACTAAAFLVCVLIATLFVGGLVGTHLHWLVAALFILTMAALIVGLVCFWREVYLAMHALRIGPPVSQLRRE